MIFKNLNHSQFYCHKEEPHAKKEAHCVYPCVWSNSGQVHIKFEILNGDAADFPLHQISFYMSQHVQKWYWYLRNISFTLKTGVQMWMGWWRALRGFVKKSMVANFLRFCGNFSSPRSRKFSCFDILFWTTKVDGPNLCTDFEHSQSINCSAPERKYII